MKADNRGADVFQQVGRIRGERRPSGPGSNAFGIDTVFLVIRHQLIPPRRFARRVFDRRNMTEEVYVIGTGGLRLDGGQFLAQGFAAERRATDWTQSPRV